RPPSRTHPRACPSEWRRVRAARWWRSTRLSHSPTESEPSADDIARAARAGEGVYRETPVLSARTLSERVGATVVLKAENLQRTGSFKIRGAIAKLTALGDGCAAGVVTGSA